ncbi:MAG TPA: 3'(2'),5'-bisphosphate nucleotidase CysQ [Chitinophagaceae bacterium]|nr:3'(2'),5'-bisphosphate nucleotidase CysQ [Chitinophagaceae bacterium]
MTAIETYLEMARSAARQAARIVMEVYRSGDLSTRERAEKGPVTRADQLAHQLLNRELAGTGLPVLSEEGAGMAYSIRQAWEWYWLVDPLDGTREFVDGIAEFTVNIALIHRGRPVAGVIAVPAEDRMYAGSAETGVLKWDHGRCRLLLPLEQRTPFAALKARDSLRILVSRSHPSAATREFIAPFRNKILVPCGSSLKFLLLAEGQADLYPRLGPTMEWDTAAGHALLNALNRGVYQLDLTSELVYNKPDLLNPFFVAF